MPTVSVIIPTFNREFYVTKAIDSILEQTFSDYEIIVVDDGSIDGTRAALSRYGDRIRYIYQENAGVSAARNTGIAAAQGDWIAYLDSDDEWMSNYLAAQMESVGRYPEAVGHITNSLYIFLDQPRSIVHFDEIGMLRKFPHGTDHLLVEKPFKTIIDCSHWFLQPIIMRREALLQAGLFNTGLSIAEDIDVVSRLALKGPFAFNRSVLVNVYRRQEKIGHLSAQYYRNAISSRKTFGRVYTDLLGRPGLTLLEKVAVAKALCTKWRAVGNMYMMADRQQEARRFYRKALLIYPSLKALFKYCGTFMPQQLAMYVVRKGVTIAPGDDLGEES
ncbi:glycosyltransferase family 2 protein [Geomonas sp. RF6]|uniref:glycosyltransferase family 2 protein n=1 Tax=Geomonas sp. RF6 TaxID=2897342 RepID=UPI001E2D2604|nr:glycosyltransferase family 2 protein [Geomonas sp. RF6]UFS68925.1 glycosyltransferase family 2 protein [Geomonas sp. RF6]